MSEHTRPYRSGITQFYWWAQYAVCWPFIRVGRGVRHLVVALLRLGRRAHHGALSLAEAWGAHMLAPAQTSPRWALALRWLVLLAGFGLVAWVAVMVL